MKHLNGLCSRLGPWVGQRPSSRGFRSHRYSGEWQESEFKQSEKFWPLEALWETLEQKLENQKECVGFMWLTTCRPNPCHEVATQLECRKQVLQILYNDNQSLSSDDLTSSFHAPSLLGSSGTTVCWEAVSALQSDIIAFEV